jgi:hypothetical protein
MSLQSESMPEERDQTTKQSHLFSRVDKFRVMGRQHSIGSSLTGDMNFLVGLKGISSEQTRDNLMVPSSPIHMRATTKDLNEDEFLHVYDGSLSPSFVPQEPFDFNAIDMNRITSPTRETSMANESKSVRVNEEQLGFSPEQLFTSLPIPPNSIFLTHSQHHAALISRLTPKTPQSQSGVGVDALAEHGLEHLAELNFDSTSNTNSLPHHNQLAQSGKRLSLKNLMNAPKKKPQSTPIALKEVLDPDIIGLLLRSFFEADPDSLKKDIRFIKKFVFSNNALSIQNHQLKAYAMFYECLFGSAQKKVERIANVPSIKKFIEREDIVFGACPPILKV